MYDRLPAQSSILALMFLFFFFYCSGAHRDLHSFPTRRSSDLAQQLLRLLLVPDEVVVDDHRGEEARLAYLVELGDHLRGLLGARHAAVDHDDVAELALERAAARELERA